MKKNGPGATLGGGKSGGNGPLEQAEGQARGEGGMMPAPIYVDFCIQEWGVGNASQCLQTCVRLVLNELHPEALLRLKDPKFEVMVLPEAVHAVWAYFPIHRKRLIAQKLRPKPETRVLLVFSDAHFQRDGAETLKEYLRDHLGHVLLYLRDPKARNDYPDAMKEWRRSILAKETRKTAKGE